MLRVLFLGYVVGTELGFSPSVCRTDAPCMPSCCHTDGMVVHALPGAMHRTQLHRCLAVVKRRMCVLATQGLVKAEQCDSCVMGSARVCASRQPTLSEFECLAHGVKVVCSFWLNFAFNPCPVSSFSARNGWNLGSLVFHLCVCSGTKPCQWLKCIVRCVPLCSLKAWLGGGVVSRTNTSPSSVSCHGRLKVHLIWHPPF